MNAGMPNTEADKDDARPFVMLVEDDPAAGQMYQMGLQAAGFVVMVLGDGSELFKALAIDVPDVVVLDWELPGLLSGVDIVENLRLDDRTAQVPVIMLSNHLGDIDGAEDRALKAGAPWLLKVRTTPDQLAERLRLVLRRAVQDSPQPPGSGS
jgi:two-component system, OmpR family, phosphate regulon response regulator PhoB